MVIFNDIALNEALCYLLSHLETQREVEATVLGVEFVELERLREEVMDEGAERHPIVPTGREVGDVNVLTTTQYSVQQLVEKLVMSTFWQ